MTTQSRAASTTFPSILLVDDDAVFRLRLARAFSERGYDVREVGDRASALAALAEETPEYAVVDLRLPGGSGLEVVRAAAATDETTRIVVLTGYGSIATALAALRLGATDYITKPADVDDIVRAFGRDDTAAGTPVGALHEAPSLARVEWEHINRVLAEVDGNVSEAARRLGVHRRSLQRKLAKFPPR
jgi:two-component system, response regulator RegA